MKQEYAQANLDAAHDLQERFHRDWPQLWEDAGLFVNSNSGFAHTFARVISDERPFVCVRCGKGVSYATLVYARPSKGLNVVEALLCYPCRERADAKSVISNFAHGRVA